VADREAPSHLPVLIDEVAFLLRPRRGGWVVDGTVGMGGHAERILETGSSETRLFGVDRDPEAIRRAGHRLARFGERVVLRHGSFRDIASLAAEAGISRAVAMLLDLGLSSYQLDESDRGFSFSRDETLDMRFDPTRGRTAADLVNSLAPDELARILFEYGEERHARRIARRIDERRRRAPLRTTADLIEAVKEAVPRAAWPRRLHVATHTFQAVRMAVNEEPEALTEALPDAASLLEPGARLGVISFHSGEDRIVKRSFRSLAHGGSYTSILPSPIQPTEDEARENPRARSAKLRVLERLEAA
jgi:16S rRNA (cytosine1402-N4)-methyltransferase